MTSLVADAATSVNPDATLILGILSGITAIVVAYFGYLGVKHRQPDPPAPANPPSPGQPEEPNWVKDLRRDLSHERTLREQHDGEIDRLQTICWLHGINPITGLKIGEGEPA